MSGVFESFRSLCLKEYLLDPVYFVSTPSLANEAILKITKAKIELLTNINMVLMIEKGIRGCLTQVIKKHSIANNKYLPCDDSTKKSVYLQYLDANNLYGWAMYKKLSLNGYKWANVKEFDRDFIKNYDDNSDKGYLLEVDVEYPKELYSSHRDLPFCVRKEVNYMKNLNIKSVKKLKRHIRKFIRPLILPLNLKTS